MQVAIVTGGSRGLGRALAEGLVHDGWSVVVDARDGAALEAAADGLRAKAAAGRSVVAVPGDVGDAGHRRALADAARSLGGCDLLVNNAGILGPSPQPRLIDYPPDALRAVYEHNVIAPLGVVQEVAALLRASPVGRVINVTSDAAAEAYEGWGGYGSAKAALEQWGAVLAVEEPGWRVWSVDPGDLRTRMHQEAFPGEDISDRPEPEAVVPALLALIGSDAPSGRVRLADLAVPGVAS